LSEEPTGAVPPPPREAIASVHINAPSRGNRRLESLLEAANGDDQLKAWWHVAQVNATRLGMSDHSWVHVQIVVNIGLRLLRLLERRAVEPNVVTDHGMRQRDAEVVVAAACLLHDTGMSIHRTDHEAYSLFLAARKLDDLLAECYSEPERSVVASEALHGIIAHRRRGEPITLEAGVVRVADALDMAEGRELLATKLRGSGLEEHVEVVARIDAEHEKRLLPIFRI
jgi:metal-dependent HD superfamily phosphatase/phosphodiesterase